MDSFVNLVQNNLDSTLWFRPELALTFGTLVLFVLDLSASMCGAICG